jgi:predicted 3-demethylubiquinone-9 3-methyltransferase (glyoxalase superfamily)
MAIAKQTISPCLWFDGKAEEAAKFYVSIFPNSRIVHTSHYGEVGQEQHGQKPGSVMTVAFELEGQSFLGLNAGPMYKFSEAVSFMVYCDTQAEVDRYWSALTADGGEPGPCGWLKDKFGLSWQVTPRKLLEMVTSNEKTKAGRAMGAMMQMKKIDIAKIESAYEGRA